MRVWAALRPSAFPYFARPILDLPRPLITRGRLLEILEPAGGERILELGPGTGYYTLPVAARLEPAGVLEILDIRQSFLDHTVQHARHRGLTNIVPSLGDGGALPYPDGYFDAAYLITVLGELPDPGAALTELGRVLKPAGRLVVGEIFVDPDFPRLGWLVECARGAGLLLGAAGLGRRGPYQLRRSFATEALAAGISIFELARVMGASVKTIDKHYGHLARDSEQAIRDRLDARAARSGVVVASDPTRDRRFPLHD